MWDAVLKAKLKATKADATLEFEWCEEETFELGNFDPSLDAGEGVIRFILACGTFLGMEAWTSWLELRLSSSLMDFFSKTFLSLEGYFFRGNSFNV